MDLRAQFPVLARIAYLNAGTDGPMPLVAAEAAQAEIAAQAQDGRTYVHFERRRELQDGLRAAFAAAVGAEPAARIELHRALAELHRNFLSDRDTAKNHYRAILEADANDLRAHAAVASMSAPATPATPLMVCPVLRSPHCPPRNGSFGAPPPAALGTAAWKPRAIPRWGATR